MYSITDRESFEMIEEYYRKMIMILDLDLSKENLPPSLLIATKSDIEENRTVTFEEGEELSKKLEIPHFIEISTKIQKNIDECFIYMAQLLRFGKIILYNDYPTFFCVNEFRDISFTFS